MKGTITLRRSLIRSFIAATLLPLLVTSVLVLYDLAGRRADEIDDKNLLLARALSGQVEGFLRGPQATLRSIGDVLDSHQPMNPQEIQSLLDTIVHNSDLFESISLIDRAGTSLLIGLNPEQIDQRNDFLNVSFSHLPFFRRTLRTNTPEWSDTFFSLISGEISLAVTQPVKSGILVGNFSIHPLTEFVASLHQNEMVNITVVDRSGTVIAHRDPDYAAQQVYLGHLDPVQDSLTGKDSTRSFVLGQQEFIGSAVQIPGPNWVILVAQKTADAYWPVRYTGILFAVGVTFALLLSFLYSLNKANRIARAASELTNKTEMIADGTYDLSIHQSGYRELDNLAANVRSMAEAIDDREQQLIKSHERYRQLVETMNDGLVIIDEQGVITYANNGLSRILGCPLEEIIGSRSDVFLTPKNRTILQQKLAHQGKGISSPYELEWLRQDGETVISLVSPGALSEDDNLSGSFAVITDITQQKQAEELIRMALAEAEEARDKTDAILKSVPLGLLVTDLKGRLIMFNRSAEDLLGHRIAETDQPLISSVLQDPEFQKYFALIVARRKDIPSIDLELFDHSLNEVRTVQVSSSLVTNQAGIHTGIIVILNDVTGQRESDRLKSEFIATAAHELSTPLTAIMGYAELLLKQSETEFFTSKQLHDFYATILDRSEALSRITEDLLQLSHMESGRTIQLDKQSQFIEDTILNVVSQFAKEAQEHVFHTELPVEKTAVIFDRGRLTQVLENLLSNAVKYTPKGGEIVVSGKSDAGEYQFNIKDNGIGMTEDQAARVFEKFYRANPSQTGPSGLGLGMSIVKTIIDAHHGRIDIDTAPGQGTRIRVSLPLT